MPKQTTKRVPARAFALQAGRCEFAAPAAGETAAPTRGPIKLTASSGEVFNARWWGPLVFDFAGVKWAKDRLALDYCHDEEEIVGYADQIDTSNGTLTVSGQLISAIPGDRAQEILIKGPAGVPYEASIAFDPRNELVIEEWQAGMTATVNGRQIAGPVTVIRQCLLRGIAVCPHGADPYTETEFSQHDAGELDVVVFTQESPMTNTKPPATPPEEATNLTADQLRQQLQTQLTDYTTRFGAELGTAWVAAGKPLIDCYAEFTAKLKEQHQAAATELQGKLDAATKQATELQERLTSLSLGETKPASTTPAEGGDNVPDSKKTAFAGRLSDGLSKFAAGLKLRGK